MMGTRSHRRETHKIAFGGEARSRACVTCDPAMDTGKRSVFKIPKSRRGREKFKNYGDDIRIENYRL